MPLALCPIDLIPDFIAIIGYLDHLILIPLGLALVIKFTPEEIIFSAQETALLVRKKPVNYIAAGIVILLWLVTLSARRTA